MMHSYTNELPVITVRNTSGDDALYQIILGLASVDTKVVVNVAIKINNVSMVVKTYEFDINENCDVKVEATDLSIIGQLTTSSFSTGHIVEFKGRFTSTEVSINYAREIVGVISP